MPHSHRPLVLILRRLCRLIPNASTAREGPSHMEDAWPCLSTTTTSVMGNQLGMKAAAARVVRRLMRPQTYGADEWIVINGNGP